MLINHVNNCNETVTKKIIIEKICFEKPGHKHPQNEAKNK